MLIGETERPRDAAALIFVNVNLPGLFCLYWDPYDTNAETEREVLLPSTDTFALMALLFVCPNPTLTGFAAVTAVKSF